MVSANSIQSNAVEYSSSATNIIISHFMFVIVRKTESHCMFIIRVIVSGEIIKCIILSGVFLMFLIFLLEDPVCARRTPHPGLWSTPLIWLYQKGSPPLSTVKQRGGQPLQWSGTRMESGWKQTKMTHVLTACYYPLVRFSSYALFMDDGANQMREPTSAWPGTTWEKLSAATHLWK